MRLSAKLFLGISGVIAATLLVFGYFILFAGFKKNLDLRIDNGLEDFQASSLIISQNYNILSANLDQKSAIILAAQYADRTDPDHINLYTEGLEPVIEGISYAIPDEFLDGAANNQYRSLEIEGKRIIVYTGTIKAGDSQKTSLKGSNIFRFNIR